MTPTGFPDSPYLTGAMEPVHDERDDVELAVTGEIPDGLRGSFWRIGPNPQFPPLVAYHPFDGDGMIHSIDIDDGHLRYRNRWVRSRGFELEREKGHALFGGLAAFTLPDPEVVEAAGVIKNAANTQIIRHAGRIYALLESSPPTQISPDLDTIGETTFGGVLTGACTAHPKIDPVTGEMMFFGYAPFPPYLRYYVASGDGDIIHHTDIDLSAPVMMHDFVVTEHWTIFFDAPAVFQPKALSHGGPLVVWEPDRGTRIGVLPRHGDGSAIRWFDIENQFVVHFFNAWEEGSTIHIAAPRTSTMPDALASIAPVDAEGPVPVVWSIDMATGVVSERQLDDRAGDFPRVNDEQATRPTRYLYNSTARSWEMTFDFDGVIKYDLHTGNSAKHQYGPAEIAGEHVFAPNPNGGAEDDGWLLSLVINRDTRATDLVVLDARDVAGEELARIHLPRRVPIGFHANWFPQG